MSSRFLRHNLLLVVGSALVLCTVIGWVLYALFGYALVEALYTSEIEWIRDNIMAGRADTPLRSYLQELDRFMVVRTSQVFVLFILLALLIKKPLGAVLASGSMFFSFSLLFILLEFFPLLIKYTHLDAIEYYAYRANYIHDDKLIYREQPFMGAKLTNFRGANYSSIYNIPVAPRTVEWATDAEGFRNGSTVKSADIILLGDSYIEYGDYEHDTFGKRLENKLPDLTVFNFGKAGYGPFQYLEVLKHYGLDKSPKYAFFGFYEGNDLINLGEYILWREGASENEYGRIHVALTGDFLQRYVMALKGTISSVRGFFSLANDLCVSKLWQIRGYIHPEVIDVHIGNTDYKMLFIDKLHEESPDILMEKNEVKELRGILEDFRVLCENNNIIPIVLYIPTAAHIYADYSTQKSGGGWLSIRDKQIRSRKNLESVLVTLSHELDLELLNLSTEFERAAKDGKMLYYAVESGRPLEATPEADDALDSHWNAEGREVAAAFVADLLIDKFLSASSEGFKREANHKTP